MALTDTARTRKIRAALVAADRARGLLDEINADARENPLDYRAGAALSARHATTTAATKLDAVIDTLAEYAQ